jgi:hypothetical protein
MVRDTSSSSHLQHIASPYYKDSDEDNSSETMKRPLITTTMSSSNASLETDEEQTKTRLEQQRKRLVWRALLLGSGIGFVLQVVVFATCYTILKIWGQHPTFSSSLSLASYRILVLLSQVDIAICIGIWSTFVYTMTKSGSLYMRKKLDQDVDTPAGANSIWTARVLFAVGIYFLVGVSVGSCSLWTIVDLRMGVVVPSVIPLLMVEFSFFYIMIMCFDWGHAGMSPGDEQEEEEEEDHDSFSGV